MPTTKKKSKSTKSSKAKAKSSKAASTKANSKKKGSQRGGGRKASDPKELRPSQIVILEELNKKYAKKDGLSQSQIREKTGVVRCSQMIKTGKPGKVISLIQRKFVKENTFEVEGREVSFYAITPAGAKALVNAAKN